MKSKRELAQDILTPAGITLNGPNPWDPQIHDEALYDRLFSDGVIAIGEGYVAGWWDVEDMPEMMARAMRSRQVAKIFLIQGFSVALNVLRSKLFNLQKKSRASLAIQKHYDIGNDLYERMLDKRLAYSCGYWKDVTTLDEAQEAKLDLICRKIGLRKGDRVLDIGCGWGSFAIFAAERYGAHVTGVTLSKEQAELARERAEGLPVEIRLQDYRDINDGSYDHIVSVGMFEHVGHKNYKSFMQLVRSLLKDDGLFLLHTIGWHDTTNSPDPWIDKYIFPDGILPSAPLIAEAADHVFVLEDWHNFGVDYERTLLEWFKNFDAHWPELREKYGDPSRQGEAEADTFYRMWKFYLLSSAGSFRGRAGNLWQIILSPSGVVGGYTSVR
jgi:cyclopropane-fatty-acyl-phospholipid synthase